jgi:hypothetical protein
MKAIPSSRRRARLARLLGGDQLVTIPRELLPLCQQLQRERGLSRAEAIRAVFDHALRGGPRHG